MNSLVYHLFYLTLLGTLCSCTQKINSPEIPGKLSFVTDIRPILEKQCLRCHSETILNLAWLKKEEPWKDTNNKAWVIAGDPNSEILQYLGSKSRGEMRQFVGSQRNFDLIYHWIVTDSLAL